MTSSEPRKRTVIIKNYYPPVKDPRVTKILRILQNGGYHTTYIGWDMNSSSRFSYEQKDNGHYGEIILGAKAPFGYSFFFFPLWWFFGLFWLLRQDWALVHVVNFPSVIPAILAAKLKNKPVIYDIEDTYIDQLPAKRVLLRNLGLTIDRLLMRFVDAVVLVDEMQVEEFKDIPNTNITVIYDSPPPLRKTVKDGVKGSDFGIFYAGRISKSRNLHLESLVEAIKDMEGVKMILAGAADGDIVPRIVSESHKMPGKISYVGWVPYEKVLRMSLETDLLFSLRDPDPPNQRYICGSKFLEAIMCGKPFLVNKGTSAATKVQKNNCGIVVDSNNIKEIKEAILKLKNDPNLCKEFGMNGRKAYEQKYGWDLMSQRLLNLYAKVAK